MGGVRGGSFQGFCPTLLTCSLLFIRLKSVINYHNAQNNPMLFPNLPTERLLLRPLNIQDAPEVMTLRSDARVNEFIDRPQAINLEEARQFIEKIEAGFTRKEWLYWAITLQGNDILIGTICLWNFSADGARAEVGYELNPAFQRQGFMQEALSEVLRYGFSGLKLKIIFALLREDNIRSVQFLKRNGFQLDAGFEYMPEAATVGLTVYFLASYGACCALQRTLP